MSSLVPSPEISDALRTILKSQYHAALRMLREAIELCPDELWLYDGPANSFWQVAYHTLFFAHMYLVEDEAAFRPWRDHQADVQNPDGIAGPPEPGNPLPIIPTPYSKAQVLEYWQICEWMVDDAVEALDLNRQECGFSWYKMGKLEHQFVNIRHIQHHTAQLADRLRSAEDVGVRWVGHWPSEVSDGRFGENY